MTAEVALRLTTNLLLQLKPCLVRISLDDYKRYGKQYQVEEETVYSILSPFATESREGCLMKFGWIL